MMVTGVELAGLILASFPIIVHALEHYGEGLETMKEWARFRLDLNEFLNDFIRQQIFFRQHIEDLLSSVVESDYRMGCMLDNPDDDLWRDSDLEKKLKQRLPGKQEYETYMVTVSAVLGILEKIQRKLKLSPEKPHWSKVKAKGLSRIGFEMKRIAYILDKKRRARLMDTLGRYNNDLQQLLGNSDRLEPTRRKRNNALPALFEQFRKQASSLHNAICQSLVCKCSSIHATKLLLPKLPGATTSKPDETDDSLRLQVYFPRKLQLWSSSHTLLGPEDDWYAANIEMADADNDGLPESSIANMSIDTASTLLDSDTGDIFRTNTKVSFQRERKSSVFTVPKDATKIQDLCAALKDNDVTKPHLGFLQGLDNYCHTIYHSQIGAAASDDICESVTLGEHIRQFEQMSTTESTRQGLRRQERLKIALIMAKTLLQLFQCPWLKDDWSKEDVVFFRDRHGRVLLETISLDANFYPKSASLATKPPETSSNLNKAHMDRKRAKASLFSLGVLTLELWFYKSLESCPFRSKYLGPDGQENEFTSLNTAQVWQEQALEEGGIDLDNLTYRCIYGDFGADKQDLSDEKLRKAVYYEVVEPLEKILSRYS